LLDAERIASIINDPLSKEGVLSGVAQALAANDPERAARLFANAMGVASSMTDESSKARALSAVAQALAATFS